MDNYISSFEPISNRNCKIILSNLENVKILSYYINSNNIDTELEKLENDYITIEVDDYFPVKIKVTDSLIDTYQRVYNFFKNQKIYKDYLVKFKNEFLIFKDLKRRNICKILILKDYKPLNQVSKMLSRYQDLLDGKREDLSFSYNGRTIISVKYKNNIFTVCDDKEDDEYNFTYSKKLDDIFRKILVYINQ